MDSLGPWIFATAVFLVISYLALTRPRARRFMAYAAGIAVLLVVAGVAIALVSEWQQKEVYKQQEEARKLKEQRAANAIGVADISLNDLTLAFYPEVVGDRLAEFKGVILNHSEVTLGSIELKIYVWNCAKPIKTSECSIIGEGQAGTGYDWKVPPKQGRSLAASVLFEDLPSLKDKPWSWSYKITKIEAVIE